MSAMFSIGELITCIDASGLPEQWLPLIFGKIYIAREIESVDTVSPTTIHQNTKYLVRLEGVINPIHPQHLKELGYAETRFEKLGPTKDLDTSRRKVEATA